MISLNMTNFMENNRIKFIVIQGIHQGWCNQNIPESPHKPHDTGGDHAAAKKLPF